MAPLLREVSRADLGDLDRARATWVEETAPTRPLGDVERFKSLISAAERAGAAGDRDLQVDLLWLVASRAWWVDPGAEARQLLIDAAALLGGANSDDPRVFAVHAYADPLGHAAGVLERLTSAAQAERLSGALAKKYGRDVALNAIIDPSVIGGLRVQVADDVIDGSISGRLADLRQRLAG